MMAILNGLRGQAILLTRSLKGEARRVSVLARSNSVRDEQGSAALVEIAIIFPVFLVMLIGIFSFAFVYFNQLTLTQAVGSGAQYLQNNRLNSALTDPCANTLSVIEGSATSLTPSSISLTLNINGTQVSASTCASDLSVLQAAQGAPVTVSATYPCDFKLLKGAIGLLNKTFSASCQLSAQVTEYEY